MESICILWWAPPEPGLRLPRPPWPPQSRISCPVTSDAPFILIPAISELGECPCHFGMAEGGTALGAVAEGMIPGERSWQRAFRPKAGSHPQPLDLPTFCPRKLPSQCLTREAEERRQKGNTWDRVGRSGAGNRQGNKGREQGEIPGRSWESLTLRSGRQRRNKSGWRQTLSS